MIFNSDGTTTVVSQEVSSLDEFLKNLEAKYATVKHNHLIINLFSFTALTTNNLMEFYPLSKMHRETKKSFVLVTNKVAYDQISEALIVAPSLQEAHDIIQMEDIERDLDL